MIIRKMLTSVFLWIFLSSSVLVCAQQSGPSVQELQESFYNDTSMYYQQSQQDSLISRQERILLHLDKPTIDSGSPLFFKAYALIGPNRVRATLSKVIKVELLNRSKEIMAVQYHKIEDGMAEGEFAVPKRLDKGIYTLRAYTRWMQNYGESFYYTQELALGLNDRDKYDALNKDAVNVSFFPEGGNLVSNVTNRLLVTAHNEEGKTIDVQGFITDASGKKMAPVTAFENGIMSVIFTPTAQEQYRFILKDEAQNSYTLPKVSNQGYGLHVNNLNEETISIHVEASPQMVTNEVWLKGEMSGVIYFKKKLNLKKSNVALEIPKKGIPFGVLSISLTDENDKQWSKRPVFIDAANSLNLSITPVGQSEDNGELAVTVRITDDNGEPVSTGFSFSATHLVEPSQVNLVERATGFVWENLDIEKRIASLERTRRFRIDLELLTSAEEQSFQVIPDRIKYPFQQGLDLFGYAYDLNNKLLKSTNLQMLSTSDTNVQAQEVETDAMGRIRIEDLQLEGKNKLVFRTKREDAASRLVKIVPLQKDLNKKSEYKNNLNPRSDLIQASPWRPITSTDVIELDEVEIVEKENDVKKDNRGVYDVDPTRVIVQDPKTPRTLPQLFLGIPGVQVVNLGGLNPQISIPRVSRMGPLLWVLDGNPLIQPTSLVDIMNMVSPNDVDHIELLLGPVAAVYGARSSGGVIAIYTRTGQDLDYVSRKEGHLNFQGYNLPANFETYAETLAKRPKKFKDKTTTVFWNSNLKTNAKGEAVVRFKSPIHFERLQIKVSTVTKTGKMASVKTVF